MSSIDDRLERLELLFDRLSPPVRRYPVAAINSLSWEDQIDLALVVWRIGPGPYSVEELAGLPAPELLRFEEIVTRLRHICGW